MIEQNYRSKCCSAKVKAEGMPDFLGIKEICTFHFSCLRCGKPCNVVELKRHKRKMRLVEKQIQAQKGRLNFQGRILQKLVRFFDGITIHPTKGVILTPKKKRQLAELNEMEQKLLKSKAKKSRRKHYSVKKLP